MSVKEELYETVKFQIFVIMQYTVMDIFLVGRVFYKIE